MRSSDWKNKSGSISLKKVGMQCTCRGGGEGERGGGGERQSGHSVITSMTHRNREGEEEEC